MKRIAWIMAAVLSLLFGGSVASAHSEDTYEPSTDTATTNTNMNVHTSTSTVQSSSENVNTQVTANVVIRNFTFSPSDVTVPVGARVMWTNLADSGHTVAGDTSGGPGSYMLQKGEGYSYVFSQPGTYLYHCSVHPEMKGVVRVTGPTSETTVPATTYASSQTTTAPPVPVASAPTVLADTGAGPVAGVILGVTLLGTVLSSLFLQRKGGTTHTP